MGKIAFVFAGQGAQYQGMGKDIYQSSKVAKEIFDISESLRPNTIEQCFNGSEEVLNTTINTQPCVYTVDLACAYALTEAGVEPDMVAGFSLGEIAALTFAGVFTKEDGFSFVCKRAQFMDEASKKVDGSMVAVMKMKPDDVDALAKENGVYAVNFNSYMQTVVAGEKGKIKDFAKKVKEMKALAVPLKVSGAFHTPYMKTATEKLRETLLAMEISKPRLPIFANMTAGPYKDDRESITETVAKQASNPVRWERTILNMAEAGVDTFYEVGPGKTLSGLIKKICPKAQVFNIENKEDLENVKR